MEHTPGPLRVTFTNIPGTDSRQWYVIDSNGDEVAASPVGPHAFNAANARLIAAAPELLKALEGLLPIANAAWERAIMADPDAPMAAKLAKIEEGSPEANLARAAIKAAKKS